MPLPDAADGQFDDAIEALDSLTIGGRPAGDTYIDDSDYSLTDESDIEDDLYEEAELAEVDDDYRVEDEDWEIAEKGV
jgi:hypothetical protein